MHEKMRASELEADVRAMRYGQGAWYWVRTYPQASYGIIVRAWVEYPSELVVVRDGEHLKELSQFVASHPHAVFTGPIPDPFKRSRRRRHVEGGASDA